MVTSPQTAAAKGLVVGALTITKADGGHVRMFDDPSGHLVPTIEAGDSIHTTASWILVVEKEVIGAAWSIVPCS